MTIALATLGKLSPSAGFIIRDVQSVSVEIDESIEIVTVVEEDVQILVVVEIENEITVSVNDTEDIVSVVDEDELGRC
jgi:hypothetical protein